MSEKPLPPNLTRPQLLSLLQQQETLLSNPIIKKLPDGGAKIINKIAQINKALDELKGSEKDALVDGITKMNIVDTDMHMSDTRIEQTNHHYHNHSNDNNNNNNSNNYKPSNSKGKEKAVPMFSATTTRTTTTTPPSKATKKENKVKVIEINESLKLEQYWKRQEIEQHHRALDHHTSNKDWENEEELEEQEQEQDQDLGEGEGEGDVNESEFWQGSEEGDLFDEAFVNGIGFFRTQPAATPQVAQNLKIVEHSGEWELDENLTMDVVPPEFEKS